MVRGLGVNDGNGETLAQWENWVKSIGNGTHSYYRRCGCESNLGSLVWVTGKNLS
jgi:hypothetical protein